MSTTWICLLAVSCVIPPTSSVLDGGDADASFVTFLPISDPTTSEAGAAASVQVVLARPPSAPVALQAIASDPNEVAVYPHTLTIAPNDWDTPLTLTAVGRDDAMADGDQRVALRIELKSADVEFDNVVAVSPEVTNVDDDHALAGVQQLASGNTFTCAWLERGVVVCWGANESGQLGDGTLELRDTARPVFGLSDAIGIGAGRYHACAIREGGSVACWGKNDWFQLGDGTQETRVTPVPVAGASSVTSLVGGERHTCALRADGQVLWWGLLGNVFTGAALPVVGLDDAVALASGSEHACAVRSNGQVACWGSNMFGQFGNESRDSSNTPVPAATGLEDVVQVAAGMWFTCFLTGEQRVYCAGHCNYGRCGVDILQTATPVEVQVPPDVVQIFSGQGHSCAITTVGQIYCWGRASSGQIGREDLSWTAEPLLVPEIEGVRAGAAGQGHSCAVLESGQVRCWGNDVMGQIGDGFGTERFVPHVPVARAVAVMVGGACLLTHTSVLCWGDNEWGQLGIDELSKTRSRPVATLLAPGLEQVSSYWFHGCVVDGWGQGQCWGANNKGQLGRGTFSGQEPNLPAPIEGDVSWQSFAVGLDFSCGLAATGRVYCWGSGAVGALGNGSFDDRALPAPVSGDLNATRLAAGSGHVCALEVNETVSCWGSGYSGELGNGVIGYRALPQRVEGVTDVIAIAAGADASCALTRAGELWCWGGTSGGPEHYENPWPELVAVHRGASAVAGGPASTVCVSDSIAVQKCYKVRSDGWQPVDPPSMAGVQSLGLAGIASCAVVDSGETFCWGDPSYLGSGRVPATAKVVVEGAKH